MTSQFKTVLLLGFLSAIVIILGGLLGGRGGIIIAFGLAIIMNVGSYWYSDQIVLSMYHARETTYDDAPYIHNIVEELARNAQLPKPKIYIVPEETPNAFATGRDPEHSAVAVTEGIMRCLSPEQLRGVLAHEMAHIKNRDILIQTIAGVMGSAIVTLANIFQFTAIFGSRDEDSPNPIVSLLLAILAPIAASLIQMAISRSREFLADETGAYISRDPLALASALNTLGQMSGQLPLSSGNPSTAQLFIVQPTFALGANVERLFSTHPPLEERIQRLQMLARR
ncbi:MAG: zinc metalloprotease HtpX [Desulfovibrionaceae bacterium]|nr:zinc metalloprotease HtpX [Desulfovibrionaceae bacterium]